MISLMMNMKLMARRIKGGNISSGRPVRLAMSHKNDRRSMILDAVVSGVLFDIISALKIMSPLIREGSQIYVCKQL